MKKKIFLLSNLVLLISSLFTASSCNKNDDPQVEGANATVEVKTVNSLEANEKVYFNLSTGVYIPAADITATNWDISFYAKDRAIALAVNSGAEGSGTAGAQLVSIGFDDCKEAPENGYLPGNEAIGDYLKWSNYTGATTDPKHAILPKPGLTFVIRTADGKYAKIQMLSLYKGNPDTGTPEFADLTTRPAFGYFSFRYAAQGNGTRNF